jgi:cyanate permease
MSTAKQNYRWVMLVLLWLIYASFSLASGAMGVLVTPIINDLRLSQSQMGLVLGSWQLVFIAASLAAGLIIDRWGVRKSILVGIVFVLLSAVLRYTASGFGTILVAVAIYGVALPMISVGGPTAIARWFTGREQGIALGIYMTGAWAGMLVALSLTNSVVMPLVQNSWRTTFLSYGMVVFIVGLLWLLLSRDKSIGSGVRKASPFRTLNQIVRIRNVQLMLIIGFVALATTHGMGGWLPRILETQGMSPVMAGYAVSANTLAGIPVVLVLPGLVSRRFRGSVLAFSALLVLLGLSGIFFTSGVIQWVSLVVMGLASSAFLPLLLRMLMDGSGISAEYLGSTNGVFLSVAQIGGFFAPLTIGALYDLSGGFLSGVLLLLVLNIAIVPVALLVRIRVSNTTQDSRIKKIV